MKKRTITSEQLCDLVEIRERVKAIHAELDIVLQEVRTLTYELNYPTN